LLLPLTALPSYAASSSDDAPLKMTIDQLSAATLDGPPKSMVTLDGSITNTTKDDWPGIKIYPFLGTTPITTEADLAHAATMPADAVVGERIVHKGAFATLPDLGPGQTLSWHLEIPRKLLVQKVKKPGVYWFGVHALGQRSANVADGRARTFIPLGPSDKKAKKRTEKVALVLPLRRRVTYHSDGRLADVQGWTRELNGRLSNLLAVGEELPDATWAIDPALIDAVHKLAAGNPPRNTGPTDGSSEPPSSSSASPDSSADADPGASPAGAPSEPSATESATQKSQDELVGAAAKQAASSWLEKLTPALEGHEVLALPYADPDLGSLAANDKALYKTARQQGQAALKTYGIDAEQAVVPPSGYLDVGALELPSTDTVTIVGDSMIKGTAPTVGEVAGHQLVTSSRAAASGGPGPEDRTDPISLRQRIVAQASLRRGTNRPLVVVLPDDWPAPASAVAFVSPLLDATWLQQTTVAGAVSGLTPSQVATSQLNYPAHEKASHLPASRLSAANALMGAGRTLQRVLTHNDTVAATIDDEALTTTSYAARGHDTGAAVQATTLIADGLRQITVEVPPSVILSSMKGGKFQVKVHNAYSQTVTVRLAATSDSRLRVSTSEPVQLDANSGTSTLLSASTQDTGTHTARIMVTDVDGTPLGAQASVPIRPAQVSAVIWWFVGTGCALLFAAIAIRLTRRVARARKTRVDGKTPTEAM
ncbi:MAG: hypothetical protein J2O46_05225, partial [Nocardioides sp.]|nr:hypothetical protein [Nocardioides sp.]